MYIFWVWHIISIYNICVLCKTNTYICIYLRFSLLIFLLRDENMLAPFPWYNRKRSKNNSLVEYGVLWIYVQEWNNWVLWEFYYILFVKFPNCPSIPTSSVFVARFCDDSHTYRSELIYLKIVLICEVFFF